MRDEGKEVIPWIDWDTVIHYCVGENGIRLEKLVITR